MKCAACGYEYIREEREVDKVVRYQSGKRKGEIKAIEKETIVFEVGYAPFYLIEFEKNVDTMLVNRGDHYWKDTADLYGCPECQTVKFKIK